MEETITGNEMYRKESRVISLEETNLIFSQQDMLRKRHP